MITCIHCDKTFKNKKIYANHIRWQHTSGSGDTESCTICNKKIAVYALSRHIELCKDRTKICPQCNNQFNSVYYKKFCSSSCSATFNNKFKIRIPWTEEQKVKQSEKLKKINPQTLHTHVCIICSLTFVHRRKRKLTCNMLCYRELTKRNAIKNPNCGGETNYKRYTYSNIIFDSSWEVDIAKYLDQRNIKWLRSRTLLLYWVDRENNQRRYYPDFYLPDYNVYIDPKNVYKQELDKEKMEYIMKKYTVITGTRDECLKQLEQL